MNKNNQDSTLEILSGAYKDTYIRLSKYRSIFISEHVTTRLAAEISALLLYFDNLDHEAPIKMYIHSEGGEVDGLFHIYDTMQMVHAPIETFCIGKCYSAAAVILAAGSKDHRFAFKNSRVMIHGIQCLFPLPGVDITNSKNYHQFLEDHNDNIMKVMSQHTGQSLDKIRKDCLEDVWMSAEAAQAYGIIDHII